MNPIWWQLTPKQREELQKLQMKLFGTKLEAPPKPKNVQADTEIENLEEIDKLMRQPRRRVQDGK